MRIIVICKSACSVYMYINCVGIVGLNNIKANDYMNVILHALTHAGPFRDYLLREENYSTITPPPGDQTFTLGTELCGNVNCNYKNYSDYSLYEQNYIVTIIIVVHQVTCTVHCKLFCMSLLLKV